MSRQEATLSAGSEIHVGAPAVPLAQPYELALRDVVQADADVAFAYVPMITLPGQGPELMLVLYCRRGADPAEVLERLVPQVQAGLAQAESSVGKRPPELGVMPISLGRPLDGLAQAVAQTDTVLHVSDVQAWQQSRAPQRPWWLRWLP